MPAIRRSARPEDPVFLPFGLRPGRTRLAPGCLLAVALMASPAAAQAGDDDFKVRLLRDGTELEMVGAVSAASAAEVARMLDQNPRVTVLQLTSEGGEMGAAFRLQKKVHDRSLTTYVPSICVSACTLIFLAGRERFMAPEARLGFHQAIFIPQTSASQGGDATKSNQEMKAWMLQQGVAAPFVDHVMATPNESVWLPTADEMLKAHVVTGVTSGARFADPSYGRGSPVVIDQTMFNTPLLRAMKKADPDNYERMRNELFQTVQAGSLDAEDRALNNVHFNLAFKHAAAVAADDAVLAVMKVNTDILEMVNNVDPAFCVGIALGQPLPKDAKGPPMPRDLAERRSAAMAAVFETSVAKPQAAPVFSDARQIMDNLLREMFRTYGDDWQYLRHPDIDPRRSCAMVIAIEKRMVSIDPADRSTLLRAKLSGMM